MFFMTNWEPICNKYIFIFYIVKSLNWICKVAVDPTLVHLKNKVSAAQLHAQNIGLTAQGRQIHVCTSASNNTSELFKQQTSARALVRSRQFPFFCTVTVKGIGRASPVPLNTVTVIIRVTVDGNGSDKYINGSKVTEILLQTGHTNVDLY